MKFLMLITVSLLALLLGASCSTAAENEKDKRGGFGFNTDGTSATHSGATVVDGLIECTLDSTSTVVRAGQEVSIQVIFLNGDSQFSIDGMVANSSERVHTIRGRLYPSSNTLEQIVTISVSAILDGNLEVGSCAIPFYFAQ